VFIDRNTVAAASVFREFCHGSTKMNRPLTDVAMSPLSGGVHRPHVLPLDLASELEGGLRLDTARAFHELPLSQWRTRASRSTAALPVVSAGSCLGGSPDPHPGTLSWQISRRTARFDASPLWAIERKIDAAAAKRVSQHVTPGQERKLDESLQGGAVWPTASECELRGL
jgi:hypothetical protein